MDTRFAISEYLDAAQVTAQLDALIKKPIYSISPAALKKYEEEYFDKKCAKSKAMITKAMPISMMVGMLSRVSTSHFTDSRRISRCRM